MLDEPIPFEVILGDQGLENLHILDVLEVLEVDVVLPFLGQKVSPDTVGGGTVRVARGVLREGEELGVLLKQFEQP